METPKYNSVEDFEDRYLIDFECSEEKSLLKFLREMENEYHTKWLNPNYFEELMELQGYFEILLDSDFMSILKDFYLSRPSKNHIIIANELEQISGKKIDANKLQRYIELDMRYQEMVKRSIGFFVMQVHIAIKEKIKEQEILLKYRLGKKPKEQNQIPDLTLNEVALLLQYKGEKLNTANASDYAQEYGYNSGQKLMEYYNKYQTPGDRILNHESEVKQKNQLKRLYKILPHLPESHLSKLKDEINAIERNVL